MTSNAAPPSPSPSLIKVTVAEVEVTLGSLVKGTVLVDGSLLKDSSASSLQLRLGLVGREVTLVHRGYREQGKANPIIYKEKRVFLSRQTTWESKDIQILLAKQAGHNTTDENHETMATFDFALPFPNELPPTFDTKMPSDSPVHFRLSECRVEYFLQASLVEMPPQGTTRPNTNSKEVQAAALSSEPCLLRVRRLIHQALHNRVALHIADVICRPQFILCGLYEQKHETFVLVPASLTEIHWSPTQQSAVTICLSDPQERLKSHGFATFRLQVVVVQRISWQAKEHGTLPLEQSWTLEPFLFWKGEGGTTLSSSLSSSSSLVDGEVVLPGALLLRESYVGQLVQVEHHVVFSIHQKNLGATEWILVGSSAQIPLQIQR